MATEAPAQQSDAQQPVGITATPGAPDAGGLSPEEAEFFRTGDTTTLPSAYVPPEAAPVQAAPPVPDPPATVDPAAAPTPPAQQDYQRLYEQQQRQFQQQMADMQARVEAATKPPPPPPIPEPDPFTDPLGHQIFKLDKLNRQIEEMQTTLAQEKQQAEQARQLNEFVSTVKADKDTFASATPDFPKAYEHIRNIRTEDLRLAGCNEADIPKVLMQDELQFAFAAKQRGENPAEQMYKMAQRYGYAAQAPAAAPAAPAPARDPVAHVQRLQNGQFAAKQPTHAAPAADLTLDNLRDAGQADLDRVIMSPDLWNSVVGGQGAADIFHSNRH